MISIEEFYPIFQKANNVVIDNRKIQKNDIFFAFSGQNFNAATLAEKTINDGALAVIVEQKEFENPEKNIFYTPSTLNFLQKLATYHRQRLSIPLIALTGSNGKTTTKELAHAVLSQKFKIQYTHGNLNNHIGVPLTILSIKPQHQIAIIEMGANHQKEIETLCQIAMPDLGYITNFGKAHLEGFGGIDGVIKGKTELYDYLIQNEKIIFINNNDPIQKEKTQNYNKKIHFGTKENELNFDSFTENDRIGIIFKNEKALSKLTGNYNFTNLSFAVSLGIYFDIEPEKIKNAIENYTPTNMRSQILEKNGKKLLLDTYNANPSSMEVSLKNFNSFQGTKTIIIGDMLELGNESEKEHSEILNFARSLDFENIITIGSHFKKINPQNAFLSTEDFIKSIENQKINSENILLKGSRGIALEKIIDFL